MKKCIAGAVLLLAACGQEEGATTADPEGEQGAGEQHITMDVPAENREDLLQTLDSWAQASLEDQDGGRFIARDDFEGPGEDGDVVQQVAADDVSEAAASLENYTEDTETDSTWTLHLHSVEHTEQKLLETQERMLEEEGHWYEEGAFLASSISIDANLVEVEFTSLAKVDKAAMEEDIGMIDFIAFSESSSAERDPDGLPQEEPDHIGTITDVDDGGRPLIDDELFVEVADADVIREGEQLPPEEINIGDEVEVWTTGNYNDSDPRQGVALAVHILTESTEEREADLDEEIWSGPIEGKSKIKQHPEELLAQDTAAVLTEEAEIETLAEDLGIAGDVDASAGPYLAVAAGESGSCAVDPEEMKVFSSGLLELHPDPMEGHEGCDSDYNPYTLIIQIDESIAEEINTVQDSPESGTEHSLIEVQ